MGQRLSDLNDSPSARVLAQVQARDDRSYVGFVRERSARIRQHILSLPWTAAQQAQAEVECQQSLHDQKTIEANDSLPFEIYRQTYVSAERLGQHLTPPC
jgi:glutamate--cysteine ligase